MVRRSYELRETTQIERRSRPPYISALAFH